MSAQTAVGPREVLRLTLPTPPSVNHLYRNVPGVGRVKTKRYQGWEREARYAATWPRLTEDTTNTLRWECLIVAHGLPRTRDIDNLSKATCDLLCAMTGLRDNYLDALTIMRGAGATPCIAVTVWLTEEVTG